MFSLTYRIHLHVVIAFGLTFIQIPIHEARPMVAGEGRRWPVPSPATGGPRRRRPEADHRRAVPSPSLPSPLSRNRGSGWGWDGAGAVRQPTARLALAPAVSYPAQCAGARTALGPWHIVPDRVLGLFGAFWSPFFEPFSALWSSRLR
ncbi:hypothetical protein Taro_051426, partial [Colocasia esculenta]|nr:hypothetical protein [Colocasia esculenta]